MESEPTEALDVVLLYSAGHLGSAITMNRLVKMPEINIRAVIKAQPLRLSYRNRKQALKSLRRLGWQFTWLLFWQRCIQGLGYLLLSTLPGFDNRLKPAWKIAAEHNIPVYECTDINAEDCQQFIAKFKPDLLVSAYFSQILNAETIALPRIGVLNIHPGWLPGYRGAMAYFWVLKNGSNRAGVSVHWIDDGIDTGQILARRSFALKAGATQETVLTHTAIIGTRLLQGVFRKLLGGENPATESETKSETIEYFPMPDNRDFACYFEQHRFFRIRDILGLMLFKKLS